jgi:hypothetical protein
MNNLENNQKSDATPMGYDTLLGAGLIVSNDINGNDCKIGDRVIVSEPPCLTYNSDRNAYTEHPRKDYEGVLKLSLKKGYYLEGDNIHFQPPKHGTPSRWNGKEVWTWCRL